MNGLDILAARLAALEKIVNQNSRQSRSEYTGGVVRVNQADLPVSAPRLAGSIVFVRDVAQPNTDLGQLAYNDGIGWVYILDSSLVANYAVGLLEYLVDDLPTPPSQPANVRATAFATNGRKAAEGVGAGTGLPVYWNEATSQWLKFYDNLVVTD